MGCCMSAEYHDVSDRQDENKVEKTSEEIYKQEADLNVSDIDEQSFCTDSDDLDIENQTILSAKRQKAIPRWIDESLNEDIYELDYSELYVPINLMLRIYRSSESVYSLDHFENLFSDNGSELDEPKSNYSDEIPHFNNK